MDLANDRHGAELLLARGQLAQLRVHREPTWATPRLEAHSEALHPKVCQEAGVVRAPGRRLRDAGVLREADDAGELGAAARLPGVQVVFQHLPERSGLVSEARAAPAEHNALE